MPTANRTFRVFVSSTFDDLIEERNTLQREVFPALDRLCELHGTRLLPIDLRWGVSDEAVLGQRMMEICLREIERCQSTGIKPNFIVLIGDRYGIPPLPALIPAQEFENVLDGSKNDADRALIDNWYQRDNNAVPQQYVLKARSGELVHADRWKDIEQRLRMALSKGAQAAGLQSSALLKYEASATHQEIVKGLGKGAEDRRHVLAYARLTDVDEPAELKHLKNFLREQLGENFVDYEPGNLRKFCRDVTAKIESIILQEIAGFESHSPFALELQAHNDFADEYGRHFVGRQSALSAILDYVQGQDRRPLFLYGASGSGKSSIMAKASSLASEIPSAVLIRRFIGATPESLNVMGFMDSLCQEISQSYGQHHAMRDDANEIAPQLSQSLALAAPSRPLMLFIDGLDQFGPEQGTALSWLPMDLPLHCHVVISSAEATLRLNAAKRLEVDPFSPAEANGALDVWLAEARRTLQPDQRRKVIDEFNACRFPLYLRLAFEEARHWRSYDDPDECSLGAGLAGVTDQLFERLSDDSHHGRVLVTHTLNYLAAARYGLTESEVIDLLNGDEDVWNDFQGRAHHIPPEHRLPAIIWSRLHLDLAPYLTQRSDYSGAILLGLHHRQLVELISNKLLLGHEKRLTHSRLAKYFYHVADPGADGSWVGTSAHALDEIPFQFAAARDSAGLEHVLTSLPYLSARIGAGRIYQVISDYALAHSSTDIIAWRDFLRHHSQRLLAHQKMLVSLVHYENFPSARDQASSRNWTEPWLDTELQPMPNEEPSAPGIGAVVENAKMFGSPHISAFASAAGIVIYQHRLGVLRMIDVREMRDITIYLPIRKARALKIACAPDAATIAVLFDSGDAELYRCELGNDGQPVSATVDVHFRYLLPEVGEPVIEWHGGTYWFQTGLDVLARLDTFTGETTEESLPANTIGELASISFVSGASPLVAVRKDRAIVLVAGGGYSIVREGVDVCSTCICGDRVAFVFTDGVLELYDVTMIPKATASLQVGIVRGAIGWDGERLLFVPESGELQVWRPLDSRAFPVRDDELLPNGLHVIPRLWFSRGNQRILLITTHNVVQFRLLEQGSIASGRIVQLFGGPVWRAVRKRNTEQWLWEGQPCRETLLSGDMPGRLYCAPDGRNFFYVVRVDRPGFILDLNTSRTIPLGTPLMGVNMAAGDSEDGCWLTDRSGNIYLVTADGHCRLVARVGTEGAVGSAVHICGDHVIWRGFVPQWYPDTGVDQARTFVFFRRSGSPSLDRVGEKRFTVREGLCVALSYNLVTRKIIMLWQPESSYPILRSASAEDFMDGRFHDCELQDFGPIAASEIAVSSNGSSLGIINDQGAFACMQIDSGKQIAVLAGSSPFIHVAPAGMKGEFWLANTKNHIYKCTAITPER